MQTLKLRKTLTLVTLLAIGCGSIASNAYANGGGGISGEYINGQALTTGGEFSCSDPDDPSCLSYDHVNQPPSVIHPHRIAHNHRSTEHSGHQY